MAKSPLLVMTAVIVGITSVFRPHPSSAETPVSVNPSHMPRLGAVDARYQSYNIEMVEVTGGRFWKPYASSRQGSSSVQSKVVDLFAYRPPIDLSNPKLRKLAAALGPAYLRVSGTWANSTYFADSDRAPLSPPPGFKDVLSRPQWKGVVDFAAAVNAEIVTSMAISPGARDASGVWTTEQARKLVDFTRSSGGRIAAAEFMNEPALAAIGRAPKGYDAAAYARDFKIFERFAKEAIPGMTILGPGSGDETAASDAAARDRSEGAIASRDILQHTANGIDVLSYHHYGALSQRCTGVAGARQSSVEEKALSEDWLASTDRVLAFYRNLRDTFAPGKPIWLTETAEAACGGNPLASTFLDTFRYLDQLGRLARAGVQVVMHNTLAASDYGLLDETTLTPRPNYWGALLWRELMGATVLDPGIPIAVGQHVYAHCQRDTPGGVALLVINNDRSAHVLEITFAGKRYTLSAEPLENHEVKLNGKPLKLGDNDSIPPTEGAATAAGPIEFAPATITFLALAQAGNDACR